MIFFAFPFDYAQGDASGVSNNNSDVTLSVVEVL